MKRSRSIRKNNRMKKHRGGDGFISNIDNGLGSIGTTIGNWGSSLYGRTKNMFTGSSYTSNVTPIIGSNTSYGGTKRRGSKRARKNKKTRRVRFRM